VRFVWESAAAPAHHLPCMFGADFPGGSAATGVVVECDGRAVPATLSPPGFVDGLGVVTVTGLTPSTACSLRCRCELEDAEVDPEALWAPPVAVVTLRQPRHLAEVPKVVRVLRTSVTLRVRNPGARGSWMLLRFARIRCPARCVRSLW
jgi:hypothetical protein